MGWFARRGGGRVGSARAGAERHTVLRVVAGPHAGAVHTLSPERLVHGVWTIGRSPTAAVPLTHDLFVSRTHAIIRADGRTLTIMDRHGRRNPSRIDGRLLLPGVPVPLRSGMVVEIGNSAIIVGNHEVADDTDGVA